LAAWIGLARRDSLAQDAPPQPAGQQAYLLMWALTPCIFFTAAGNILWTYVLPGLPALALLVGGWTASRRRARLTEGVLTTGIAAMAIGLIAFVVSGSVNDRFTNRSAKDVLLAYQAHADEGESLYFLGKVPFSASFYSAGQARALASLSDLASTTNDKGAWVVVDLRTWATLSPAQREGLSVVTEKGQRMLLRWR
jgi:hypothetical protein